jgi:hypothetical protein
MAITIKMNADDYKLLSDSYYGEGGFIDGTYLTKHKRESDSKHKERVELSYYLNYVRPVVDSHVNAVFSSEPSREYKDKNGLYEAFINDADGNGNSLNRAMKELAVPTKLKDATLIVVDNYSDLPSDLESTIEGRKFPYIFKVEPENVIGDECIVDDRGKLQSVTYYESDIIEADGTKRKSKRLWDTEKTQVFKQSNTTDGSNKIVWELIDERTYNHGKLPCFFFCGSANIDNAVLPTSQFLHPAKVNKAIYNLCSEIREIQRKQTFSILTMPGQAPEGGLTVGTESVLYYPEMSTNVPAFIAPADGPATILAAHVTLLISEIYRMACVSYTQQYASGQQSGESKRWTFHITRQVLEDFATNCEIAEKKIAEIFGAWINHDLQANIQYSRKYGADDIDADINRTDIVLKMGLSDKVNAEVQKKFIRSYFADMDDLLIKSLEEAIDNEYIDKEANKLDPMDDTIDTTEDEAMIE